MIEHDGCGDVSNTVKYEVPRNSQICTQYNTKERNGGTDKSPLKNKDKFTLKVCIMYLQQGILHLFNKWSYPTYCYGSLAGGTSECQCPSLYHPALKSNLIYSKLNHPYGWPAFEWDSPTECVLCSPALLRLDPSHHLKGEFSTVCKLSQMLSPVSASGEAGSAIMATNTTHTQASNLEDDIPVKRARSLLEFWFGSAVATCRVLIRNLIYTSQRSFCYTAFACCRQIKGI